MSNLGIEFGNMSMRGTETGSITTDKFREAHERLIGETAESGNAEGAKSFGDFMKELAQEANATSLTADAKMSEVAAGRNKDLHGAVLAMEKADVQFRLLSQVRNKVIDAYREIMRMQV